MDIKRIDELILKAKDYLTTLDSERPLRVWKQEHYNNTQTVMALLEKLKKGEKLPKDFQFSLVNCFNVKVPFCDDFIEYFRDYPEDITLDVERIDKILSQVSSYMNENAMKETNEKTIELMNLARIIHKSFLALKNGAKKLPRNLYHSMFSGPFIKASFLENIPFYFDDHLEHTYKGDTENVNRFFENPPIKFDEE